MRSRPRSDNIADRRHAIARAVISAVVSDTHARPLPSACAQHLRCAAHVIHAGDIVSLEAWREFEALGVPLTAVRGNCDEPKLGRVLPERAEVTLDGLRFGVIHDAGPASGRLARLRRSFPEADVVVFGHSHAPLLERAPDGFAIFNPGSATQRRRQPRHTMGVLESGILRIVPL